MEPGVATPAAISGKSRDREVRENKSKSGAVRCDQLPEPSGVEFVRIIVTCEQKAVTRVHARTLAGITNEATAIQRWT